MSRNRFAIFTACLGILGIAVSDAFEKVKFEGGTIMGYTYGQNGVGWPRPFRDPLSNPGRGGFYISQLRLQTRIDFDSTFKAVAVGNFMFSDVQEVYLHKTWGNYRVLGGKFRGAGLKSGTGFEEFDRVTVNAPFYARVWAGYKRTFNFRDIGVQVERDFQKGNLQHRFFLHNATGENVFNNEPSAPAGNSVQVLGMDYALDWRISPFTQWGGHVGALAHNGWDEFVGKNRNGWEVGYWFKTNPLVDASVNHQMDMDRFHIFNEALIMYHRNLPNPVDLGSTKTWGVSSMLQFDHSVRWGSFFRYEYFDNTDGLNPDDSKHLFTFGGAFHPSPATYPKLKVIAEYVRTYEDAVQNLYPNDLLYCQMQMQF